MSVRIETPDRLNAGDHVDHDGAQHVVVAAAVWSDAAGNYAYTEAVLDSVEGGDA